MVHKDRKPRQSRVQDEDPARLNPPGNSAPKGGEVSRRDFIKGTGIAGVAFSAGALLGASQGAGGASGKWLGPEAAPITLRINGQARQLSLEPRVTLLDALRDRLDITGAKKVCDRGTCGACTVILDGKAVYSCSVLAMDAQRRDIETIEGLSPEGKLHALSQAFVDNDAQQCGFCTPGFVMACKAYLDHNPNPTYEGVQKALGGNLCRCGTYIGVRHAVLAAAEAKGGRT